MFNNCRTSQLLITDKRIIFSSRNDKRSNETDSNTQYQFMTYNLGMKIYSTSVPQTKGRIERL